MSVLDAVIDAFCAAFYNLDTHAFRFVHASVLPTPGMLFVARWFADGPLWLTVIVLASMLIYPRFNLRACALKTIGFVAVALLLNAMIGWLWNRPRPFVAGMGKAWIAHASNASFPSDHLTVQWVFAGILILNRRTRWLGIALALLGLPMAWARIYLGVHYPGDMLGALLMGLLALCFVWMIERRQRRSLRATIAAPAVASREG